MEKTFSLSRDMTEEIDIYLKWWKVTWRARLLSGDMDNFWRKSGDTITQKCL